MDRQIRNILIVKPSALGDIVLALPALSALREAFPDAKISWLVRPEYAALVRGHPHLDTIIEFDRRTLGAWWYKWSSFKALLALLKKLRQPQFDVVFDLQGLFRSALLTFMTGARLRFGPAAAREGASLLYNKRIRQEPQDIHLVDYFLSMVRALTQKNASPKFILPGGESTRTRVADMLKCAGVDAPGYAVLVPGSARPQKCWPTDRFAAIAEKIASTYALQIVAVGSKGEKVLTHAVKAASKVPIADLAGQTNIEELVCVLTGAKLVVSNDTGPGHIAAAAAVPTVLLFGPTNPARVCPYGRINDVVAYDACSRGFKPDSFEPHHAIERISIDDAWSKIQQVLSAINASRGNI